MTTNNLSKIDQSWPEKDLEHVEACPYCGSQERSRAYKDVQDWSFYCAPGKWVYWDCTQCKSLYLDPRPTRESIGEAYGVYYTHDTSKKKSVLTRLKNHLKNECYESWYGHKKTSRLYRLFLSPFKARLPAPFWMQALACIPVKGRLIDVGCGDGTVLEWANKLGWSAVGIEIDPLAVASGRGKGLDILEGTYEKLTGIQEQFDCVMCLHVIEHVHNPVDLLEKLISVLKPNGILVISTPNASSRVRAIYQESWRGLEAPRHLGIPDLLSFKLRLTKLGFKEPIHFTNVNLTGVESSRIQRRATEISICDKKNSVLSYGLGTEGQERDDIVQLVCRKST